MSQATQDRADALDLGHEDANSSTASKDLYAHPFEAYRAYGVIQNVVHLIPDEAVKKWFKLENSLKDDEISRLIEVRFQELGIRKKLRMLLAYARIYPRGSFMYASMTDNMPDPALNLAADANPKAIKKFLVLTEDEVTRTKITDNPLSDDYENFKYQINGKEIHPSRIYWQCHHYNRKKDSGISVVQQVYDAAEAHDRALYSVTQIMSELLLKVFKTPSLAKDKDGLRKFLQKMRNFISTKSVIPIEGDEELKREVLNLSGIGEAFTFIWESLCGICRIPKSRLTGQEQGALAGAKNDRNTFAEEIAFYQQEEVIPIIDWITNLIIREDGEIKNKIGNVENFDWEWKANPLMELDRAEMAEVEFKEASADEKNIRTLVLSPSEARRRRFQDLPEFAQFEGQPTAPAPEDENANSKKPKEEKPDKGEKAA